MQKILYELSIAEEKQKSCAESLNLVNYINMPKRTYQPKKVKRIKKHGYRARVATAGGKNVIKRRRAQGRARLTI